MNTSVGASSVWWTSPLDLDAQPFIPFPRERRAMQVSATDSEPLRARIARVMRTDVSVLKSSVRQCEPELVS